MGEGSGRKPVVVLAVVGAVVVLVFALGVGLGGRGEGDGGWRDRLAGLGGGAELTADDLVLADGTCDVADRVVSFSGACVFEVVASGGRFSLAPARRATLVVGDAPVTLTVVVEEQEITTTLDPGEVQDLTFGRSGGALGLACRSLTGCTVSLAPPV